MYSIRIIYKIEKVREIESGSNNIKLYEITSLCYLKILCYNELIEIIYREINPKLFIN